MDKHWKQHYVRLFIWKQPKSALSSCWHCMQYKTVWIWGWIHHKLDGAVGWWREHSCSAVLWLAACAEWGSSCRGETMLVLSPSASLQDNSLWDQTDVVTGVRGRRAWRQTLIWLAFKPFVRETSYVSWTLP